MRIDEFLLARIAEDEAAVHAETVRGLHVGNFPPGSHSTHGSDQVGTVDLGCRTCRAFVVSLYAGPRALAECEAKRAIVAIHKFIDYGPTSVGEVCERCVSPDDWVATPFADEHYPCSTVRHLAAVYAGHPDYDPAWRL